MLPQTKDEAEASPIEIRVEDIGQLFDTLDPFPFRDRDLDRQAEDYIVGWARELPSKAPVRIVIHLPESEARKTLPGDIAGALARYFSYRAESIGRELTELIRMGRRSLAIGITILVVCLLLSHLIGGYLTDTPFGRLAEESFLILGWVANWRPLEIFLYDWWPIARRRELYRRLSAAEIDLAPYGTSATTPEPAR